MTKLNPLQMYDPIDEVDIKHMQVVYLNKHGFDKDEISKYTGYAISTIRGYISKFADLLEKACEIFATITQKAKKVIFGKRELVYLFKFYDEDEKLICSKVGTTTRLPEERMKEELRYYRDHGIEVTDAEICSVIDCNGLPAEGAESYTRAMYIKKHPEAFCKNDRFFNVDIPVKSFNTYVNEYLGKRVSLA